MEKFKIIALYGMAGAGKDTILNRIIEDYGGVLNLNPIISCTTRPPREGEIDGVAYHFLSNEEFANKVLNGDMLEATEFRNWFYGTPIDSLYLDKVNIGVFNIAGIECLQQDPRLEIYPVYVTVSDKTRLIRQLNREKSPDCHEICRRFFTDEQDFDATDIIPSLFLNNEDNIHICTKALANLIKQI